VREADLLSKMCNTKEYTAKYTQPKVIDEEKFVIFAA
jgi:hypothetical protein